VFGGSGEHIDISAHIFLGQDHNLPDRVDPGHSCRIREATARVRQVQLNERAKNFATHLAKLYACQKKKNDCKQLRANPSRTHTQRSESPCSDRATSTAFSCWGRSRHLPKVESKPLNAWTQVEHSSDNRGPEPCRTPNLRRSLYDYYSLGFGRGRTDGTLAIIWGETKGRMQP
jgi:hypothetical protein